MLITDPKDFMENRFIAKSIVGDDFNPSNQVEQIMQSFQDKFQGLHYELHQCTLGPLSTHFC